MERKTLVTTEEGKEVEIEYPEVLKVVEFTPYWIEWKKNNLTL